MDLVYIFQLSAFEIDSAEPETAHLYQMWVDPSGRGLGAGRMLLEAVVTWAISSNARYLVLGITCGNTPANRLYSSAGFNPVGAPEPLREGSVLMSQRMMLELESGTA